MVHLLEGLDNIAELRREEKVTVGFVFFAEEEKEHECF